MKRTVDRPMALDRSFFARPTLEVARDLIGVRVVHEVGGVRAGGVIVETEAYIGEDDPACHASAGLTRRTALMYGPPGVAYVYLNYGIHFLLNAVTEAEGHPAAVLIRALAPDEGIVAMRTRRGVGDDVPDAALCRGPGNLTRALGISLAQNGADLCGGSRLTFEAGLGTPGTLAWGPRIGLNVGTESPWRCAVAGHPAVSGPRAAPPVAASRARRRRGLMADTAFAIAAAATPDDLEVVRSLFRAYADAIGVDLAYQDFATELATLPGKYAAPAGALLLARDGAGAAIGCVALRPMPHAGCCEMKRLYVAPAARGLGLGRALMDAVLGEARRLGYREIRLDTLPTMTDAIVMYRRAGFTPVAPYYDGAPAGTHFLGRAL